MASDSYELHHAEEWSAAYKNGELLEVGDSYWVIDTLLDALGVARYDDDAFLRGGNTREGVAKTLDELHAYQAEVAAQAASDDALEAQAKLLEEQAQALRARKASSQA
jgi:hypothetical protein